MRQWHYVQERPLGRLASNIEIHHQQEPYRRALIGFIVMDLELEVDGVVLRGFKAHKGMLFGQDGVAPDGKGSFG